MHTNKDIREELKISGVSTIVKTSLSLERMPENRTSYLLSQYEAKANKCEGRRYHDFIPSKLIRLRAYL